MRNIAVLVSGGGTNLQAIIDSINCNKITNCKISKVISSKPDVYALKRAENNGINSIVINRRDFDNSDSFCNELILELKKESIDLIVLAGFLCILTEKFIKEFQNKIINVHPSLIPAFCGEGFYGLKVHEKAIERGVKLTGATVHFVNEITDGGPIIIQKAVEVLDNDNPESLQKRVMENAEWEILPKSINLFCNDKLLISDNKVIDLSHS